MNAIIYVRVSTSEQADYGYSLPAQEEFCREYAIKHGYNVLKVFVERGESAKTLDRTELKALLLYVRSKKNIVEVMIVHRIDRLSRNSLDCLTVKAMLAKSNVSLKSVTEPIDDSPAGVMTVTILSSVAQFENDIRADRTKSGMIEAVKQGWWLWPAPYGYIRKTIDNKSYLFPSEDAPTIKKIFDDFISGKKQFEIVEELSLSGINITKQHLNNILKNPLYMGKMRTNFFPDLKNGNFEPIIDEVTFYKVQQLLNPNKKRAYSLEFNDQFPLKKLLKCPNCNRYLTGSFSTGRHGKKYPYYHCTIKSCSYKPIRTDYVHYLFIEYLKSYEMDKEFISQLFDNAKEYLNAKQYDNKNILAYLKKEITELEQQRDNNEDYALRKVFSEETYTRKAKDIESKLASKKVQVAEYERQILNVDELMEFGKKFYLNLSNFWHDLEGGQKRCLQEMLFPEGIYLENNNFRTALKSPILSLIESKKDLKKVLVSTLAGERGFEPGFYKEITKIVFS